MKEELVAIGVDLGRLAFEEFVIDDKRVQDQRSSNAQAIANTTAQVTHHLPLRFFFDQLSIVTFYLNTCIVNENLN